MHSDRVLYPNTFWALYILEVVFAVACRVNPGFFAARIVDAFFEVEIGDVADEIEVHFFFVMTPRNWYRCLFFVG